MEASKLLVVNEMNNEAPASPARGARPAGRNPRARRWFAATIGVALTVWSGYALLLQSGAAQRPVPEAWSPVFAWRAGTPAVQDVRRFAERVAARVPEGEPILFTLGEGGDDEFFLSMWTAYYLPRHRVLRRQNVAPGTPRPHYRIDFPSWPPGGGGPEMGASQGVTGSRKLLDGLGTLWYRPPTLGASRSGAEDSGR